MAHGKVLLPEEIKKDRFNAYTITRFDGLQFTQIIGNYLHHPNPRQMDKLVFGTNYYKDATKMLYSLSALEVVPDSTILTRSEIIELIGNAFEAGIRLEASFHPLALEDAKKVPNKQQYIDSIITK